MPGPDDYNVKVHVSGSQLVYPAGLELNAIIDGKKYILTAPFSGVLAPGDYNAKLVSDEHLRYAQDDGRDFIRIGQ